ncbi:hypothetical protein Tco_0595908 [Tanacetum coccineum]
MIRTSGRKIEISSLGVDIITISLPGGNWIRHQQEPSQSPRVRESLSATEIMTWRRRDSICIRNWLKDEFTGELIGKRIDLRRRINRKCPRIWQGFYKIEIQHQKNHSRQREIRANDRNSLWNVPPSENDSSLKANHTHRRKKSSELNGVGTRFSQTTRLYEIPVPIPVAGIRVKMLVPKLRELTGSLVGDSGVIAMVLLRLAKLPCSLVEEL